MPRLKTIILTFLVLAGMAVPVAPDGGFTPAGEFSFILSGSAISGVCPMGRDGSGSLAILAQDDEGQEDGTFLLTYVQGMTCNPAQVCDLAGSCQGRECEFSTTVVVDGEGGQVTNTATVTFDGNVAHGTGSSVYRQPGFECSWTYLLTLVRK